MADDLVAVSACVLLVVASGNAEGNQTAAEPAADKAKDEAEDPAQSALLLNHVSHASVPTVLALNGDWVVWPVVGWERASWASNNDHARLYHWLTLHHWLSHWLLLHHRLSHWLLLHHRLSYGLRLSNERLFFTCFAFHLN